MKTNSINLVGAVALSLLASSAFAGKSPDYTASTTWHVDPVVKGQIKLNCVAGTGFKNEFPLLTNGNGGGTASNTYTIPADSPDHDPVDVNVEVSWFDNNSFGFTVSPPGAMSRLIVSSGQTLDYDYLGVLGEPKASDTGVHLVEGGGMGPDISHIDFCLFAVPPAPPVDADPPQVSGVTIDAVEGEGTAVFENGVFTVSGLVDIRATVTDDSGVSVIVELDGEELAELVPDPAFPDGYVYRWPTTELEDGNYKLKVVATDEFGNETMVLLDVTVVTSFQDCLSVDGVPEGKFGEGGCVGGQGTVTLEYPERLRGQVGEFQVTQRLVRAFPQTQFPPCTGSEFITNDPAVDGDGNVVFFGPRNLAALFDVQGHFDEFHGGKDAPDELWVGAELVAAGGCIALYYQEAPDFDELIKQPSFYFTPDSQGETDSPTSVLTQDAVKVPGLFDNSERITAPLNFCDLGKDNCKPLPECFLDDNAECFQPYQGSVERATMLPDNPTLLVLPLLFDGTFDAFNPARTRSFKGTFGGLNFRSICEELEQTASPFEKGTAAYLQAEYECKIEQTLELFFDLETAIKQSARNLPGPKAVNDILNPHSKALSQIKVERFNRALRDLDDLLDEVAIAPWFDIDEFNDPGRLVMYTEALIFRVKLLQETEQCLNSPGCLADLESLAQP